MRGAVHNQLPTSNPVSQALCRAVGDDVGTEGIERYGETLSPVIDLWHQPEWALLRGDYLVAAHLNAGPVAGEYSNVALVNPAGSGMLAVVEEVTVYCANACLFILSRATEAVIAGTLAVQNPGYVRDSRSATPSFVATGGPVMYQGTDAAAPFAGQLWLTEESCAAASHARFGAGLPVILSPGHGLIVEAETLNIAIRANFTWRQRKALRGELV